MRRKLAFLIFVLFLALGGGTAQNATQAKPEESFTQTVEELASHPEAHLGEDLVVFGWAQYKLEEIRSLCWHESYDVTVWNCDITWYELFPVGTQSQEGAISIKLASARNDLVYARDYKIHGQWSVTQEGDWYLDAARQYHGTRYQ